MSQRAITCEATNIPIMTFTTVKTRTGSTRWYYCEEEKTKEIITMELLGHTCFYRNLCGGAFS